MTHVVLESCIRCKYTDCVDVCPVDCFREGPNFLTIDPDECIDCAVCIPECPVNAIVPEEDVPGEQQHMIKLNADLAKGWPSITRRKPPLARRRRLERPHRQARPAGPLSSAARSWPLPSFCNAGIGGEHDRDRCADRRRRPGRLVPGVRARPAGRSRSCGGLACRSIGGQCIELYADKPIYDIPALPATHRARIRSSGCLKQVEPFAPTFASCSSR